MCPAPPAPPFVKVCGFTDPANLRAVCGADARPDAVGLNLWPKSKRFAGEPHASHVWVGTAPLGDAAGQTPIWGVFVNSSGGDLLGSTTALDLAAAQLHGDEPPERTGSVRGLLGPTLVVKAWRPGATLAPLIAYLADAASYGGASDAARGTPDAVLLDAAVPGAYGGTGAKLDWHALRGELDRVGDRLPPVILAGGLTPGNVAEAVRVVKPWGVDVAGGVESSPGVKDPAQVRAFVENAKSA